MKVTFSSGHLKLSVLFGQGGFRVAEGPEAEDYFLCFIIIVEGNFRSWWSFNRFILSHLLFSWDKMA